VSEVALCRECGGQIAFEPARSGLAANNLRPSLCESCAAAQDAGQAALLVVAEREARCLPPRYRSATFESFTARTPSQELALGAMRDRAAEGVMLVGGAGCGKTHLACAAISAGPVGSLFVNTAALLDDVRKGYEGEGVGLFARALTSPLLALDDLGSEAVTDWVRDRLYTLLNHRWDHYLPLIVTTNVRAADLAERIGRGVASRIAGCCAQRISGKGPDARREAGER
jgi:DNA replication protein DnaC